MGGNAVDAAIVAQLVLGLVEPQSSGLGGGAFVLYYDALEETLYSLDGRETAPQSIPHDIFLDDNGQPLPFYEAVIGGQSVGIPGTPALLKELHERFGRLPLDTLLSFPMSMAQRGFPVSGRLSKLIEKDKGALDRFEPAASYFYNDDGSALTRGSLVSNPEYYRTLLTLRDNGFQSFYDELAPRLVDVIREHGGYASVQDFKDYRVIDREPVCVFYRAYKVCSMGEPSSGGLTLLSILGMLERFDLTGGPTAENVHLIAEASRLAFADRNQFMADPEFVDTPGTALIEKSDLSERSQLIDKEKRMRAVVAGQPDRERGTTHISIVDSEGSVLAMTSTIEGAFGSKLMVDGFLLNNELTDFSFKAGKANSVEGGKRPRSSMSPTIIFDPDGAPYMTIGSAGGSAIIGYVAQRIIAVIDWDMPIDDALNMPNFVIRSDVIELERASYKDIKESLLALGHDITSKDLTSGLTAIMIEDNGLIGAADPRREGGASGK
jgi:gamma-glutamyltranspeptidase/glutathione hydrolase